MPSTLGGNGVLKPKGREHSRHGRGCLGVVEQMAEELKAAD